MNRLYNLLNNALKTENISVSNITARIKKRETFITKAKKKGYSQLKEQFTDFAGLRIITQNTEEVDKICNLIEKEFDIDWVNSVNKKNELGSNLVGYISYHYIVSLNEDLINASSENKNFKGLKAEIQVRTILQHAWAELSHDKIYKSKSNLDAETLRRVNIFAGFLEVADEKLLDLNHEIEDAFENIDKLSNKEINSISLSALMQQKFDFIDNKMFLNINELIEEVNLMGIYQIDKLKEIIKPTYINYFKKHNKNRTYDGVLKNILALNFGEEYFIKCKVQKISEYTRDLLKHFEKDIEFTCKKLNIIIQ